MMTFPAVFLSHGAPDLSLQPSPVTDFLSQLGAQLGRPQAILCISAHWGTSQPQVSAATHPRTIHDFGGFPEELYRLRYPAPGAPELAQWVVQDLVKAGLAGEIERDRGLDHGAWVPLQLMYPDADIPVTQLSVQPHLSPAHHFAVGQALAGLRSQGVLIVASGGATHNLWEFGRYGGLQAPAVDWAQEFADWLTDAIARRDIPSLLNYRQLAPHAQRNHPTDEHLLPLFVALGAGGENTTGRLLHQSFTYGLFSMAAYAFASELEIDPVNHAGHREVVCP